MNKLVKDALILTLITLIAGIALGTVYEITKAPIAKANEKATQEAYKEVFQTAKEFTDVKEFDEKAANKIISEAGYSDGTITSCEIVNAVSALDADKKVLGYVITVVSHSGYGGDITLSLGVTKDGQLNGYSITDISETAGLGMKATESSFMEQFKNIPASVLEVVKTSDDDPATIEAISGATITSKAVTYAVDAGMIYASSLIIGGAENE